MIRTRKVGIGIMGVMLASTVAIAEPAGHDKTVYLEQGWTDAERDQFYFTP